MTEPSPRAGDRGSDGEHAHAGHEPCDHEHAPHAHATPLGAASLDRERPPSAGFTPGEARQARRLTLVLGLVSAFFVLELGGAIVAESVVLQADAIHLLTDVLALGVSLLAMRLAVRRPTPRFTYGLRRAEPVAAIISSVLVLATTVFIVIEALDALHGGAPPRAGVMLVVAVAALFVNGVSAWLLHDAVGHGHAGHAHEAPHAHDPDNPHHAAAATVVPAPSRSHGHALNLRGASLHLLGDTLGALAALIAAIVLRFGGSRAADPVASFFVAAILFVGSLRLLRDATLVLLEAAPPHLPVSAIAEIITRFPGVTGLHDLHVWTLGAGHDAITAHVRTGSRDPSFGQRLSTRLRQAMPAEYVTVQVEITGDAVTPGSAGSGQAESSS